MIYYHMLHYERICVYSMWLGSQHAFVVSIFRITDVGCSWQ